MKRFLILVFLINSAVFAGSVEPLIKWDKTDIKVCWWDHETPIYPSLKRLDSQLFEILNLEYYKPTPMLSERRSIMKNIVLSQYSRETTGIHFKGWKNCSDSKNYDVVLYAIGGFITSKFFEGDAFSPKAGKRDLERSKVESYYDRRMGRASLGQWNSKGNDNDPKAYLILLENKHTRKDHTDQYLEIATIHEFGHLAGLRHEHIRYKKAFHDPLCQLIPDFFEKEKLEGPDKTTFFTSTYDPKSIMNYCLIDNYSGVSLVLKAQKTNDFQNILEKIENAAQIPCSFLEPDCLHESVKLSKGDIHALKCLYVFDGKTKNELCHEDYPL